MRPRPAFKTSPLDFWIVTARVFLVFALASQSAYAIHGNGVGNDDLLTDLGKQERHSPVGYLYRQGAGSYGTASLVHPRLDYPQYFETHRPESSDIGLTVAHNFREVFIEKRKTIEPLLESDSEVLKLDLSSEGFFMGFDDRVNVRALFRGETIPSDHSQVVSVVIKKKYIRSLYRDLDDYLEEGKSRHETFENDIAFFKLQAPRTDRSSFPLAQEISDKPTHAGVVGYGSFPPDKRSGIVLHPRDQKVYSLPSVDSSSLYCLPPMTREALLSQQDSALYRDVLSALDSLGTGYNYLNVSAATEEGDSGGPLLHNIKGTSFVDGVAVGHASTKASDGLKLSRFRSTQFTRHYANVASSSTATFRGFESEVEVMFKAIGGREGD